MKEMIATSPSSFGQITNEPYEILESSGFQVVKNPYGRKLTEEEIIGLAKDCVGIVAGLEPLTARVMDALPKLKCISRVGVGMDNVDMEHAIRKGIAVVNTPDGPTRAVAELTIGMTFSLLRKIPQAHCAMKNRRWDKQIGNLLHGKKIGIIGLGRIGRMVSEMFITLGNEVSGFDLYPDTEWAQAHQVRLTDLETVLTKSDLVSVHVPPGSEPLIGKKELSMMNEHAFLINLSRGGVIDEVALFNALATNRLAGAAIDVFSKEPYAGPLCDLDQVILTPHLGSYAKEGKLNMEIDAVRNLINVLNQCKC